MNDKKKSQKIAKYYECIKCYYITGNKTDYKKHIDTQKHYNAINGINDNKKSQKIAIKYNCDKCSKIYIYQSGLSRHKKTCKMEEIQLNNKFSFLLNL
jgi:predicted RNA-binding Zn-ribbon protein involved in translation (DUF1610 family)